MKAASDTNTCRNSGFTPEGDSNRKIPILPRIAGKHRAVDAMSDAPRYRPNVACILRHEGKILVCERADAGGCWQFPQGGIMEGETPEQALARELEEEIGITAADYKIILRRGPYRYLFDGVKLKQGYEGQEQTYFLVELLRTDWSFHAEACPAGEFCASRWIRPDEFRLDWTASFKRGVYQKVFEDFFGIRISSTKNGNSH